MTRRLRPYQALDLLVAVLGVLALAHAVPQWGRDGYPIGFALLAVPVVCLVSRFPLVLLRPGGDVEIGFDAAVLVVLGLLVPHPQALVLWSVAGILGQALSGKRWWARMFNAGLLMLVGALALATMSAVGGIGDTGARELLAVLAAAAVYFTADWLITALSLASESGQPLRRLLFDRDLPVSLVWFLGVSSIGYLAVLMPRSLPLWTECLLIVPTVAMLVAARAVRRGGEHGARLSALLAAASSIQKADNLQEVLDRLTRHAARVLRSPRAQIRSTPPRAGELGFRLSVSDAGGGASWLVCAPRAAQRYERADRRALTALCTLAEEFLLRLRMASQMTTLATRDPLTGLANRTLFRERIAEALDHRRRGTQVAVLFCDLDDFKPVNDRFGHEGGDAVLRAMAGRLMSCVREGDTVARLGGDEFALLLTDLEDAGEAVRVAERVLAAGTEPIHVSGRLVPVGVSIGLAVASAAAGASAGTLLGNADLAMYEAKAKGKSCYRVFVPGMRTERLARIELTEQLRGAAARGELVLRYQPVLDLTTGVIAGFEALVRWQHPERGLLLPGEFIPLAEESGLLAEIGSWQVPQAYADACELSAFADRAIDVGVNVSVRQLQDDHLLQLVMHLPKSVRAPNLVLEVTESVFVEDEPYPLELLRRLREAGVHLALDDFGTGYSSVAYLRNAPFNLCKIHRSFTSGLGQDPRADALCRAVLAMCDSLGVPAVAEGIEDLSQVSMLRAAGCQFGQGFALGGPVEIAHARELLRAGPMPLAGIRVPAARSLVTIGTVEPGASGQT